MQYTKKLEKALPAILVALVFLAIVLGSFVYKKSNPNNEVKLSNSGDQQRIDSTAFTPDELKLLVAPGEGASKEEIIAHSELAAKLSVAGDQVDIKDCKASPLVLRHSLATPVKFKNTGSENISISFNPDTFLEIGAGKTVSDNKSFVHGPGVYGYLCKSEGFTGLVGFVLAIP